MDVAFETGEWIQGSEGMLCLKQVNGNKGMNGCCG